MTEELWILRGSDPVLWTIPFYVTWNEKGPEGAAHVAIPLLKCQQRAVDESMAQRARKVNGLWMIIVSELRKIGTIATPGTDPETCLTWERRRIAQKESYRFDKNRERDEFLDALYLVGVGNSRDEVGHWWYALCNHALDWLINKERPVDMFFLRLVQLPYRGDWIAKTHQRKTEYQQERKRFDVPVRFEKEMRRGCLLSMNDNGTIKRRVEVEHLPLWWKTIKRVEFTRLTRLNPFGYALSVIESICNAIPAASRIYKAWLAQKRTDGAMFVERRNTGGIRINKVLSRSGIERQTFGTSRKYREALWNLRRVRFIRLRNKAKALSQKNGHVPKMSDIQPQTEDVRIGGQLD